MDNAMYPPPGGELSRKRRELAPKQLEAFRNFSAAVFADGALPNATKQLIAVAVAHTTSARTASRATPRRRSSTVPPKRRSWRRSGSRPKCAPAAPTRTPTLRWTRCCTRTRKTEGKVFLERSVEPCGVTSWRGTDAREDAQQVQREAHPDAWPCQQG